MRAWAGLGRAWGLARGLGLSSGLRAKLGAWGLAQGLGLGSGLGASLGLRAGSARALGWLGAGPVRALG